MSSCMSRCRRGAHCKHSRTPHADTFPSFSLYPAATGARCSEVMEFAFQVENVSPSETLADSSGDSSRPCFGIAWPPLISHNVALGIVTIVEDQGGGRKNNLNVDRKVGSAPRRWRPSTQRLAPPPDPDPPWWPRSVSSAPAETITFCQRGFFCSSTKCPLHPTPPPTHSPPTS